MSSASFSKLLEPISVGGLRLRNRIVMSPMEVDFGSNRGEVTARTIDHYRERATGGVGLVIVEATCVETSRGRLSPRQLVIDSDHNLAGFQRLARAVQSRGARILVQLNHAGRKTTSLVTGNRPVAPSPITNHFGETPEELTRDDIAGLVDCFAAAAARVQLAGFDGVELHAAHGYLASQFLSPTYNRRRDEYGGSVENRARFLLEVVSAVKSRVGRDFPLICRLSAMEYRAEGSIQPLAGGITVEETRQVARLLEQAGVHALDISATLVGETAMHPMSWPEGMLLPLAAEIKQAVGIPVIATGRISPERGERALRAAEADLIAMARSLLADPYLPEKLAAGRPEDVIPCIFCPVCLDPVLSSSGARCAVNPALGHERELRLTPAERPKQVMVLGGGPGGMEAARVARLRGHEVVLYEEGESLGGRLLPWSKFEPASAAMDRFRQYLVRQMSQVGVDVKVGVRGTAELAVAEHPDAVVVATGGLTEVPSVPGIDSDHVLEAADVLRGMSTGETVAILGAEFEGCEVALFLERQGKRVALLTRRPKPAMDVTRAMASFFLRELQSSRVSLWTRVQVEEIHDSGVTIRDRRGEKQFVEARTVVLATGRRPDEKLLRDLERHVSQVVNVGGGEGLPGLTQAMEEGYRAGLEVS